MRDGCSILLAVVLGCGSFGLVGCSGRRLNIGEHGAGGGHAGSGGGQAAGAAGTAAGAAGSIMPSGAGGQAGGGGATGAGNLSVTPSSATFASTLVEAVSAPRTFTVRNDGGAAIAAVAALEGTNGADFSITANGCGTTLQPGASCDITVAFAPKTRSGSRSGRLTITVPSGAPADVSLIGTALPSLGLVAGVLGAAGYADGTGAAARFGGALGIASDGAGNLYVADTGNSVIRKIVIATAAVTTFAGAAGQIGSTDGTGAAARFSSLAAITNDGAGNLYVADNHAIRKVVIATGAVTTLAGASTQGGSANGTGAAARFNAPSGVASDGAGNLYVADTSNRIIRRIVVATGAVTTLAGVAGQVGIADGTGVAARFATPTGVVADGAGSLYVADPENGNVRKIVIATGAVSTLPGTFEAAYAVTSDGSGNLYVTASGSVRRVVIATGAMTTLAGAVGQFGPADGTGAAARFGYPLGVASDGAGNLYVADSTHATVRKLVVATGDVSTLAGAAGEGSADGTGTAARFFVPSGIASDGAGNLYVADLGNLTIRAIGIGTRAVTTLAGTAGQFGGADGIGAAAFFDNPSSIAADGAGKLHVGGRSSSALRTIVVASRTVTTSLGGAVSPAGVTSDGAGNLYLTDSYWNVINKVDIATGTVTPFAGAHGAGISADGTGSAARFARLEGIASDRAGNLYVADWGSGTIRKVVIATAAVTTLAGAAGEHGSVDGTGAAARFDKPTGIASDGAGNVYVADGSTIRKVVVETATVSTIIGAPGRIGVALGALPASLAGPNGVAVLPTGELAIVDSAENSVLIGHL